MIKILKAIYKFIGEVLILPIRLYKKIISPMLGNNCRFYPTCSEYAMQAIRIHGAVKGIV
ncbi:MAG: membrane protein insertion efficiency factor YidD, partial [Oscillospiraceae bacterium]